MTLTTRRLREVWAPPCHGPFTRVNLYGAGVVSVDPRIVHAVTALNACLVAYSYETRRADTGAYNCRKITGGTGYSLHAYRIALDINWQSNPYGPRLITDMPPAMVDAIKAIRTGNGKQVWRWGGDYAGNKDAMHFEIVCTPADLETGVAHPTPPPPDVVQEDDEMKIIVPTIGPDKDKNFLCGNGAPVRIEDPRQLTGLQKIYGPQHFVDDLTWDVIRATGKPKV